MKQWIIKKFRSLLSCGNAGLKAFKILTMTILVAMQIACDGGLYVSGASALKKKVVVESLSLLAANPKDEVVISGKNLTKDLEVTVNGSPVAFNLKDSTSDSFIVPDDLGLGIQAIVFAYKGNAVGKFPLMNAASVESLPTLSISPDSVCNTFIFKDPLGKLMKGKGNCDDVITVCTRDGQTHCKAVAGLPAVSKVNVAAKILSGQLAGGVNGTAPSETSQCSVE